jgi:hypothetical protein
MDEADAFEEGGRLAKSDVFVGAERQVICFALSDAAHWPGA